MRESQAIYSINNLTHFMTKTSFDFITFFYKIFLLTLLSSQLYALYNDLGDDFTLMINGVLSVYLVFRLYLLVRLGNKAKSLSVTLSEFLEKRLECNRRCDECYHKYKCKVKS